MQFNGHINYWNALETIYLGDSITYGYGVTDRLENRWTALFSEEKYTIEDNRGVSFSTLTENFSATLAPPWTRFIKKIFISFGTNDILQNHGGHTVELFESKLREELDNFVDKGYSGSDFILITPYYIGPDGYTTAYPSNPATIERHEAFVNVVISVGIDYNIQVVDVYKSMKNYSEPLTLLNDDQIHPNNIGHRFIADEILLNVR